MTKNEIAKIIDHTNLKSSARLQDIVRLCSEASLVNFRAVCVFPYWVKQCKTLLETSGTPIAVVNDFPFGMGGESAKVAQAHQVKYNGADEIDTVINIGAYNSGDFKTVETEIRYTAQIFPHRTKVILEVGHWSDIQITHLSKLIGDTGASCLKTETGFGPKITLERKARCVEMMKKAAPHMQIKASARIYTLKSAKMLINAGADIIGSSSGIKIIE